MKLRLNRELWGGTCPNVHLVRMIVILSLESKGDEESVIPFLGASSLRGPCFN